MVTIQTIDTVEQLVADYDLFLFDQYGVLHDGRSTYPGMIECLQRIKAAGKAVAVISNSGKRAHYNAQRLSEFGFGPDLVDIVVSSGEVAWAYLRESLRTPSLPEDQEPDEDSLPESVSIQTVLYLGKGSDRSAIDGLPLIETDDPLLCDIIMITGCEPDRYELEEYSARLRPAAERGVPAYCTNPDRWVLAGASLQYGSGQVATEYHSMGGIVTWIGKPHADIYQFTLKQFAVPAERVVCIGDSVEHDIAGAGAAGCHSLLTSTGILAELSESELQSQYSRFGATPDYAIRRY